MREIYLSSMVKEPLSLLEEKNALEGWVDEENRCYVIKGLDEMNIEVENQLKENPLKIWRNLRDSYTIKQRLSKNLKNSEICLQKAEVDHVIDSIYCLFEDLSQSLS